jgi:exonuclease V
MLYHRLLSSLIIPGSLHCLDFVAFWARLGIDPSKTFSDRFMSQAGLVDLGASDSNIGFNCLNHLTQLLKEQARDLDVPGVDETLQLMYRTRPKNGRKGKSKGKEMAVETLATREQLDIAKAIEESLQSMNGPVRKREYQFAMRAATSMEQSQAGTAGSSNEDYLTNIGGELTRDPDMLWVLQKLLPAQAKEVYGQGVQLHPGNPAQR